jgi:hypothetical protein
MKEISVYSESKTDDVSKFYRENFKVLNFKAGGISG